MVAATTDNKQRRAYDTNRTIIQHRRHLAIIAVILRGNIPDGNKIVCTTEHS